MADLLLIHGYFLGEDAHEQSVMRPYPPLGLLYLSAYLKGRGFAVDVCDTTFRQREAAMSLIAEHSAPVVGIYTNLITRPGVLALAASAKSAGKTVVVGGPESAGYPDEYLRQGADVVVFGEGEAALDELLPALAARGPHRLHDVPGIAFRDEGGAVQRTEPRTPIPNLDDLPWPDREAIDVDSYVRCWRDHHGEGAVSLITARGCPYKCRWCSHGVFGYSHRRRSPADVAAEVEYLRERYAPDLLWYADDVFTINYRWLRAFHAEIDRRGLAMPFETITRADRVTDEVVALLQEMGCTRIWIGSESGSQRILDAMERGVTVDQVQEATRKMQAAGIRVGMFLMWGYPGEEPSDIAATIDHVKKADPDIFLTTVAYPIKGTPYYAEVEGAIVPEVEWAVGSDRRVAVRGRRSRRYYLYATRRLKSEVELHRLGRTGEWRPWAAAQAAANVLVARAGMRLTEREVES